MWLRADRVVRPRRPRAVVNTFGGLIWSRFRTARALNTVSFLLFHPPPSLSPLDSLLPYMPPLLRLTLRY